jgi:hypothetical protein
MCQSTLRLVPFRHATGPAAVAPTRRALIDPSETSRDQGRLLASLPACLPGVPKRPSTQFLEGRSDELRRRVPQLLAFFRQLLLFSNRLLASRKRGVR